MIQIISLSLPPQAASPSGALPPPAVVRRLLTTEAGALDDVLSHAPAAAAAIQRLTAALAEGGAAALEAAPLPRLTWTEMQQLTAARAAGEGGVAVIEGGERARSSLPAAPTQPTTLPAVRAVPTTDAGWDALDEWVEAVH